MNIKAVNNVGGTYKLNPNGVTQMVGEEAFKNYFEKRTQESVVMKGQGPWRKIDFSYDCTEELLEGISNRYNLEKLEPGELCQVLDMLKQGGVITSEEYWLGQSVIPVVGSTANFPKPEESENAINDYYSNFKTYVDKNSHLYSPQATQRLQDSVVVHEKIDAIFKQIQFYRK